MPADMSPHALLHTIGFLVSFASLIAACFVFARRFNGLDWRGWTVYSAATGLAPVPFIALSLALGGSGVPLFVMGVITSAWVAALRCACWPAALPPTRLSEGRKVSLM